MSEVYFSVDIETDGLIAGFHSMISLGAVAFDLNSGKEFGTFYRNLIPDRDMKQEPSTMEWWKKFPEAYAQATSNAYAPWIVMKEFEEWWKEVAQENKAVFAYWKPNFDGAFLKYYRYKFLGTLGSRFSDGLDIKAVTAFVLGKPYSETKIEEVPVEMKGNVPVHLHNALKDAIEQKNVLVSVNRILQNVFLRGSFSYAEYDRTQ